MKRRILSAMLALVMVLTLLPSTSLAENMDTANTARHVHDYNYGTTWIFPTCDQQGYTIHECECGASYKDSYTAPAGHNYVDGYCERCGELDPNNPVEIPLTGPCGENTVWTFDRATGTLTISGEGPMADYSGQISLPWKNFIPKVTRFVVKPGVTSVGDSACVGFSNLTEVVLPEGLTRIGVCAFSMCRGLQQITLPYSLTEIGDQAFDTTAITGIIIPANVRTMGNMVFSFCDWLRDIWFEGDAPVIGEYGSNLIAFATAYYPAGNETWTEEVRSAMGGDTVTWVAVEMPKILRIAGADRIATSLKLADQLKETLGVDKFGSVIVASALNFPDALTGSYLAAVEDAPILLTYDAAHAQVREYIEKNLVSGGTVYILGGESAVAADFAAGLNGYNVKRVAGTDRFGTNLAIMQEAGVSADQPILIATALNFADSLSASAAGLPMVLVYGSLREDQKEFLTATSKNFIIIGGTSAVSDALEAELKTIGSVERLAGAGRYETSVLVARRFVQNPDDVVLAYARNFPDGLCGGPLAYALGAPLILTDNIGPEEADRYVDGITAGIVVGGTGLISEDTARAIFDHPADTVIIP